MIDAAGPAGPAGSRGSAESAPTDPGEAAPHRTLGAWWRAGPGPRLRGLLHVWRGSLRLRVLLITSMAWLLSLGMVSIYLSDRVRDALYDQRVVEALADAATRTQSAQQQFDAATASTSAQVQELAVDIVQVSQSPESGAIATLLRGGSEQSSGIIDFTAGRRDVTPSDELRLAVQSEATQQWQAIDLGPEGRPVPGIVVGSLVYLPQVGYVELYFAYSLAAEQDTLHLIQRTLTVAGLALLALLAAMAMYLTRRVLAPVQQAAATAERLASGRLDERMVELGSDEFALLSRSFNEMASSLQDQIERHGELSRVQRQFVSDVSHELRTPLTTVRMATELIYAARATFTPATRRSAELLQAQVDRFELLLADLLEISRFDAGAAVLDVDEHDVAMIVERAVDGAAPLAERSGVDLRVEAPETACRADVDPRRVERVVRNLLANAIEHAESQPVDVVVRADERAVAVSVIDHGVGMTPQQAGHVFDRFWRGDPSRARTIGGTGLGLAISLEDARLHGGTLEAWGSPGVGATFRLTLPRRAGIVLAGSPGPLEREIVEEPAVPPADDTSGPAAVPTFEELS